MRMKVSQSNRNYSGSDRAKIGIGFMIWMVSVFGYISADKPSWHVCPMLITFGWVFVSAQLFWPPFGNGSIWPCSPRFMLGALLAALVLLQIAMLVIPH